PTVLITSRNHPHLRGRIAERHAEDVIGLVRIIAQSKRHRCPPRRRRTPERRGPLRPGRIPAAETSGWRRPPDILAEHLAGAIKRIEGLGKRRCQTPAHGGRRLGDGRGGHGGRDQAITGALQDLAALPAVPPFLRVSCLARSCRTSGNLVSPTPASFCCRPWPFAPQW